MSDKLQDFVKKNKKDFDTAEPSKDLWNKIDSRLDAKTPMGKSKWISNLKYFGFGASILVIAAYLITQSLNDSSSNELADNPKDSAMNSLGQWVKTNQNRSEGNEIEKNVSNSQSQKNEPEKNNSVTNEEELNELINGKTQELKDTASKNVTSESGIDHSISKENDRSNSNSSPSKEEAVPAVKLKKEKISAPAEPEKINSFNTSVYESSSLCEVLRIYKFPGQVSMDESGNYQSRRTMKTMSCSKLENTPDMKAIWIKGKISKKLSISIKEGFKNIYLVKSDGRKINPQAISHYYPGLGVISDYTGKYFDMTFKDKVDMILFFKDVEAGDKVVIDERIEAVVKD